MHIHCMYLVFHKYFIQKVLDISYWTLLLNKGGNYIMFSEKKKNQLKFPMVFTEMA